MMSTIVSETLVSGQNTWKQMTAIVSQHHTSNFSDPEIVIAELRYMMVPVRILDFVLAASLSRMSQNCHEHVQS